MRIDWVTSFHLLEVEAGKATYKEFIHADLVLAVSIREKMRINMYTITIYKCVHWQENEIILGILQEDNTNDTYDVDENNTCIYYYLISYTAQ